MTTIDSSKPNDKKLAIDFGARVAIFKKFVRSRQSSDCLRIGFNTKFYMSSLLKNCDGRCRDHPNPPNFAGYQNVNIFSGRPVRTYIQSEMCPCQKCFCNKHLLSELTGNQPSPNKSQIKSGI